MRIPHDFCLSAHVVQDCMVCCTYNMVCCTYACISCDIGRALIWRRRTLQPMRYWSGLLVARVWLCRFAPNQQSVEKAKASYERIFSLAARVVAPDGVIAMASCSSHITAQVHTHTHIARRRYMVLGCAIPLLLTWCAEVGSASCTCLCCLVLVAVLQMFEQICSNALTQARRRGYCVTMAGQPEDHPFPMAAPELRYLKFNVYQLEG